MNTQHRSRCDARSRRAAAAGHDVLTCTPILTRKVFSKSVLFLPRAWADISHRLNTGTFAVRGHAASLTLGPRARRAPVIRGLVPIAVEHGLEAGACVRVEFDLAAREAQLSFPQRAETAEATGIDVAIDATNAEP
ncbi:hypothetical protein [Paraburkholderia youngii]|uniref:hypothetical protein n=1 Tax=Paraburkholderia youngii TaxID=2782701 RepID=UPI003D1A3C98